MFNSKCLEAIRFSLLIDERTILMAGRMIRCHSRYSIISLLECHKNMNLFDDSFSLTKSLCYHIFGF